MERKIPGHPSPPVEQILLRRAIARLRAGAMAITFGMTAATGILVATVWLLIRGGDNVGQHLGLLSNYMPGYSVTWPGAMVGGVYGAVYGAIVGWVVAVLYNRIVEIRERRSP